MLFILDLIRISMTLIIIVSLLIAKVIFDFNYFFIDDSTSKREVEMQYRSRHELFYWQFSINELLLPEWAMLIA